MATHASFLAWRIPWTEELWELSSMGLHIISHMTSHTERFNKLFRPLNNGPEKYFSASSFFFSLSQYTQWQLQIWETGKICRMSYFVLKLSLLLFGFDVQIFFLLEFLTSVWLNVCSLTFTILFNYSMAHVSWSVMLMTKMLLVSSQR